MRVACARAHYEVARDLIQPRVTGLRASVFARLPPLKISLRVINLQDNDQHGLLFQSCESGGSQLIRITGKDSGTLLKGQGSISKPS
jgi:hypothetical protein